jgi:hypothetical protein
LKPNKIKILGREYKILYLPTIDKVNTTGSNDLLFGQIEYIEDTIRLYAGLKPFPALQVLFHEIIHGINVSMNAELKEKQIDSIALGIVNVLIDNKMLKE